MAATDVDRIQVHLAKLDTKGLGFRVKSSPAIQKGRPFWLSKGLLRESKPAPQKGTRVYSGSWQVSVLEPTREYTRHDNLVVFVALAQQKMHAKPCEDSHACYLQVREPQ